jgi:hypothetical protein
MSERGETTMNRRDFFKLAGLTGLGLSVGEQVFGGPLWGMKPVYAQSGARAPLFLSIHAGGGWDPTSLCDPKGREDEMSPDPVNHFFVDQIGTPSASSPIQWAPMGANAAFFNAHYDKLLIVNGVDTSTNNHMTGTRYVNSGILEEGHPAFGAMLTANVNPDLPLGYITNGGYDITRGVVPRTRLGQLGVINKIAEPDLDGERPYHLDEIQAHLDEHRQARLRRLSLRRSIPKLQQSVTRLGEIRNGQNELRRLKENIPDLNAFSTGIGQQGAIALAGYRAGLTAAANLTTGGFDTHGNHDVNQANAMDRLTAGVTELWAEIERLGMEDEVLIMVTSDFGRTPRYNEGNGKDHWSITSVFFMGAGVTGNRVVGASDPGVRALTVNPQTLALDPSGVKITPGHLHASLRAKFGVDTNPLSAHYPLQDEALPGLFG